MSDKRKSSDEEIYKCAYYLPGVLCTLGPSIWKQLSIAYKALVGSKSP